MIKNLQVTILILIIVLSAAFIVFKLSKKESLEPARVLVNVSAVDLTTATSTASLLSQEELKMVIDSTTAPE